MKTKQLIALLSCSILFVGCTNDNSETLMDNPPVMGQVTYTQNVKSIIDNNCISCHAAVPRNGAPMPLVTYEQVQNAVQSRGLLNRISLNTGNSLLMPQGGPRLPQATIDMIIKWNQDGLLK